MKKHLIITFALIFVLCSTASAQYSLQNMSHRDISGTILLSDDGTTFLFNSDLGDNLILSDYTGFTVGDRVHIIGTKTNDCYETHLGNTYYCYSVELIELYDCSDNIVNCCDGIRGNIDNSPDGDIDIADIVYLVEYSFYIPPGPAPPCFDEADLNGDGVQDIGDLVYLVEYSFGTPSGPAPLACPEKNPLLGTYTFLYVDDYPILLELTFFEDGTIFGNAIGYDFSEEPVSGYFKNNSLFLYIFYAYDLEGFYSGTICDGKLSVYEEIHGWGVQSRHIIFTQQ